MTSYQYPSIVAGQRITASLLTNMEPQFVVVPTTTSRASTTTQVADPYLTFPVSANGLYVIEFFVIYAGLTAANMNTSWSVPAGTSGTRSCIGPASNASNASADQISAKFAGNALGTTVTYGCARNSTTAYQVLTEWASFTAASSGNVALAWSQATSNATATSVVQGSWGRCTQLQ